MYYLSEFCLLCLNFKQLESAFRLENDEFSVQEQLKYCLPEIMISKSEIPNFICTFCRTTVNLFYKFRKTCLENYSRLTQYTKMLQASSDPRCHKFSELQIQINKLDLTMEREEDLDSELNIKNEIANSLQELDQRTVVDDDVDIKEEFFPDSEDQEFYLKHLKYEPAPDNEQDSVSRSSREDDNQPDVDEANFSADTDSVNATCTNADVEGTYFKCSVCDKKFAQKKYLTQHMKIHTGVRNYKCSVCNKKFLRKSSLNRHMDVHVAIRKHKCTVCDKMFLHRDTLSQHMKIHTGSRDYKCSICDKMFVQKSTLYRHMEIHEENRNFKCSVCNKKFVNKSSLIPHMKKHEGRLKLDYECSVCSRKFVEEVQLERHMKLHANNVGFDCAICNKKFLRKRNFVAHMNKHAGIRKYKCSVCDKTYFGKNSLASHMRKHKEN